MSTRRGHDGVGRRDRGPGPQGPPPSRGATIVRRLALAFYALVFIVAGWVIWHQVFHVSSSHAAAAGSYSAGGGSTGSAYTIEQARSPTQATHPTPAQARRFANRSAPEFGVTPTWLEDFTTQPDGPVTGWRIDLGLGTDGWYNQEVASSTDSPANLRIQNGRMIMQARQAPPATGSPTRPDA